MHPANAMLMLVPDKAMPFVLLGVSALVLIGLIRPRSAAAIALGLLIMPMITERAAAVIATLPVWFVLTGAAVLLSFVLRGFLALFIGVEGASHAMAILFIGSFRILGQVLAAIARGVWWLFTRILAPRQPQAPLVNGGPRTVQRAALVFVLALAPLALSAQSTRAFLRGSVRSAASALGEIDSASRLPVTAIGRIIRLPS